MGRRRGHRRGHRRGARGGGGGEREGEREGESARRATSRPFRPLASSVPFLLSSPFLFNALALGRRTCGRLSRSVRACCRPRVPLAQRGAQENHAWRWRRPSPSTAVPLPPSSFSPHVPHNEGGGRAGRAAPSPPARSPHRTAMRAHGRSAGNERAPASARRFQRLSRLASSFAWLLLRSFPTTFDSASLIPNPVFPSAVDAGHRAIIFSRLGGVQDTIKSEGLHFR